MCALVTRGLKEVHSDRCLTISVCVSLVVLCCANKIDTPPLNDKLTPPSPSSRHSIFIPIMSAWTNWRSTNTRRLRERGCRVCSHYCSAAYVVKHWNEKE